jgi:hypothetical protein
MFYWGAILFSQTSGKSLGDWMADTTTKAGHSYSPQAWCWSRGIFLYESLAQPNVAARRDPASATLRQRRANRRDRALRYANEHHIRGAGARYYNCK